MAKQQRTMRVEQRSQMAAMQQLESKSDDELEAETKNKAAAQAIQFLLAGHEFLSDHRAFGLKLDRLAPMTVQRVRLEIEESMGSHEGVTVKLYA